MTAFSSITPHDAEATILMIQWALWKIVAPMLEDIGGERFQEMASNAARQLYHEGMRFPLTDKPEETVRELHMELVRIAAEIGPPPIPAEQVVERAHAASHLLYKRGWRRVYLAAG